MKWFYILIISFLFSCSSQENKKLYEQKMAKLQNKMWWGLNLYNNLIDYYKEGRGVFPNSLTEVYLDYKDAYPEDMEYIEQNNFIDIFSKNNEWVGYFPIYSSDDSEIISYLILSAGIDGKLDNINDSLNKFHLNDWEQKLNLYNPDEFDDHISIFSEKFDKKKRYGSNAYIKDYPYNAKEEKYGNKDLLLHVHHYMLEMPEEFQQRIYEEPQE